MAKKLTILDIARLAGVSTATVSRVLNQKPDVDLATRERILRIMEEQGFVPNIAASGLAGRHSRLLGALVPSLTWPLVPEPIGGVGDVVGGEAARQQLGLGRRRIAHIQGPLKYQVSHCRYLGYCDALNEARLALDPALVREGAFTPPTGRACANAFFDLPAEKRPTAIF